MLATTLHLVPVLAAEKSKVPFYIAGGVLVAWALFLSLVLGTRLPNFPATAGAARAVMAITAVLVVAAVSMAVVTSGGSEAKVVITPVSAVGREAASGSGTSTLKDAADPAGQLRYTTAHLSAPAGKVTISFTNASPLMHNMTFAQGTKVIGATPTFEGGTKAITLNLKPGKYVFYCSVPGHRAAGMEGTLTVQ